MMSSRECNVAALRRVSSSPIILYAEYLLNIKTATVFVLLHTESSLDTEARIAYEVNQFTVQHDGAKATLKLPARVARGRSRLQNSNLANGCGRSKELRFRFQVEGGAADGLNQVNASTQDLDPLADVVPWSASEWTVDWSMRCAQCDATIVSDETLKTFKDLPSENWAEMMDFWHCHKPHNEAANAHSENEVASLKGYSASSRLLAHPGTLFVEQNYFLLSNQDCQGIELSSKDTARASPQACVWCTNCKAMLGHEDAQADGLRLFKWSLSLFSEKKAKSVHVDEELWVSSYLLSKAEDSASRKVIIQSADKAGETLVVWIFTPDMRYSSSRAPELQDRRAMKVLWQQPSATASSGDTDAIKATASFSDASLQCLNLPPDIFAALMRRLRESRKLLPPSARMFQAWNVSLLHRFTQQDAALTSLS